MCMQDVDIDRQTRTRVWFTTASLAIPGNINRLSLRLTCNANEEAELYVRQYSRSAPAGSANVLLATVIRAQSALAVGTSYGYFPQNDITLANVGEILKMPLLLNTLVGNGATVIETYLDVNSGQPLDITQLPTNHV